MWSGADDRTLQNSMCAVSPADGTEDSKKENGVWLCQEASMPFSSYGESGELGTAPTPSDDKI